MCDGARAPARQLAVLLLDTHRAPLRAGILRLQPPDTPATDVAVTWTAHARLPLGDAALAGEARFVACGFLAPPARGESLISASRGGRVVSASSTYSDGYAPERTIYDERFGCWASATRQVTDQWLIYGLPGEAPVTIAAVGIDPTAEASYPTCAVREFAVQVSTTGTAPEDFHEVYAGRCTDDNHLQRFTFPPAAARYVKLLCKTNRGSNQWMELSAFEVYAAPSPSTDVAPLVAVVEDFSGRGDPAVDLLECRGATAAIDHDSVDGFPAPSARLTFDFQNLLGGAPQHCGLVLDRPLAGRPRRLQFDVAGDPPGNGVCLALRDAHDQEQIVDAGRLTSRGRHTLLVDLPTDNPPVRLTQVRVIPHAIPALRGTLRLGPILALSAAR
jgi:hypothetical protein